MEGVHRLACNGRTLQPGDGEKGAAGVVWWDAEDFVVIGTHKGFLPRWLVLGDDTVGGWDGPSQQHARSLIQ